MASNLQCCRKSCGDRFAWDWSTALAVVAITETMQPASASRRRFIRFPLSALLGDCDRPLEPQPKPSPPGGHDQALYEGSSARPPGAAPVFAIRASSCCSGSYFFRQLSDRWANSQDRRAAGFRIVSPVITLNRDMAADRGCWQSRGSQLAPIRFQPRPVSP